MTKLSKLLITALRFLFGIYLFFLGLRGLSEVNTNKFEIIKTLECIESFIIKPYNLNLNLALLKQHPIEILYFKNIAILYSGFLLVFGLTLSKAFLFTAFFIDLFLQKNLFFEFSIDKLYGLSVFSSLICVTASF